MSEPTVHWAPWTHYALVLGAGVVLALVVLFAAGAGPKTTSGVVLVLVIALMAGVTVRWNRGSGRASDE